jgi:hypothetical protein
MDLSVLARLIEDYPDKRFLVRAGLIGGSAILGVLNLIHGIVVGPQIEAPVNKFNWYLGTLVTTAGLFIWPPIIFFFGDATNAVVLVFGAAGTVALGIFLAGRARNNERLISDY